MIYPVLDFLRSRLGQMLVLSVVVIVIIVGVGAYHQKHQQDVFAAGAFPRASEHPLHDRGKTIRVEGKNVYGHVESNPTFESFQPPVETLPAPEPILPILNLDPLPQSDPDPFQPISSLIASERAAPEPQSTTVPEPPTPVLSIEPGALLHCQLTSTVSSDQGNAPVQAILTRPFIRRGRPILPVGTRLIGKLQGGKEDRMYFADEWQAEFPSGQWVTLNGQVQEKAYNMTSGQYLASDGQNGLPAITQTPPDKGNQRWLRLLGTFGSAATRVAQNRTRTAFGDHIPASARNVLLEGAGGLIEDWMSGLGVRPGTSSSLQKERLSLVVGTAFYISIFAGNH